MTTCCPKCGTIYKHNWHTDPCPHCGEKPPYRRPTKKVEDLNGDRNSEKYHPKIDKELH